MFEITDSGMYKYNGGKEIICKYIWCEDLKSSVEELDALIESPTSLKEFYNKPRPRLTHSEQKKLDALVEKLNDCSIKADKKLNILGYKIKRPFYYYVTTFNYLKRMGFDIECEDRYLNLGRGLRVDDIYYLMYVEFSKKAIGKEVLIVMKNKIENVGCGIYTWKPPFSPSQSSLLKAALKIFDKLAIKYNDDIEKAFEEYNESIKKK